MAPVDPALEAATYVNEAARHFSAVSEVAGEDTDVWRMAEASLASAERSLAETVPTTARGALAHVRALTELLEEDGDSLVAQHLKALSQYLKKQIESEGC